MSHGAVCDQCPNLAIFLIMFGRSIFFVRKHIFTSVFKYMFDYTAMVWDEIRPRIAEKDRKHQEKTTGIWVETTDHGGASGNRFPIFKALRVGWKHERER